MKKTVALSVALLALHSASAFAVNIAGTWKGSGKISDNAGVTTVCEKMEVTIVHTASVLNVSTKFTCGGSDVSSPGGNLEIRGGDLLEKGAKIGTISANSVILSVKDAEHTLDTSCQFSEKDMTFHTVSTFANDPGHVITFDGRVSR